MQAELLSQHGVAQGKPLPRKPSKHSVLSFIPSHLFFAFRSPPCVSKLLDEYKLASLIKDGRSLLNEQTTITKYVKTKAPHE